MDALSRLNTTARQPMTLDVARPHRAHLVGIGGNGMRALAETLHGWGWRLTGSDADVAASATLAPLGARICCGHAAQNVPANCELVVFSDAVPAENPERRRAAELRVPAVSYFELVGALSAQHTTTAIAGTHGKSTTTAMTAHILSAAGREPTVFCGAATPGRISGGQAGRWQAAKADRLLLVEACEYRANFLHLCPRYGVILGIEPDHFDCYDSFDMLEQAFAEFAARVPSDGWMLVRYECAASRRATTGLPCATEAFGFATAADWSAQNLTADKGRFRFDVMRCGRHAGSVRMPMPGRHNVLNALAAIAAASRHGISGEAAARSLETFPGLQRRLEVSELEDGVALVDDYAHHPTEVTAALTAVREMYPTRRVICIFQPHQASRTQRLLDELAASLQNADRVLIAEIFRAREASPRPGEVSAADLARRTRDGGVAVLPGHTRDEIAATLETHLASGDVLVILGAGDTAALRPRRALHAPRHVAVFPAAQGASGR